MKTYPAATGTGGTPTPHGSFYITELLQPTNSGYGPYAFVLSAFSTVLSNFGGGPGQIGLHGTEDASSIGHAASHGCIRLNNTDITQLAHLLPLGTPITIKRGRPASWTPSTSPPLASSRRTTPAPGPRDTMRTPIRPGT